MITKTLTSSSRRDSYCFQFSHIDVRRCKPMAKKINMCRIANFIGYRIIPDSSPAGYWIPPDIRHVINENYM